MLGQVGKGEPATASELPSNRPANRFINILPYDVNRVKLLPVSGIDGDEGTDYINASWISVSLYP